MNKGSEGLALPEALKLAVRRPGAVSIRVHLGVFVVELLFPLFFPYSGVSQYSRPCRIDDSRVGAHRRLANGLAAWYELIYREERLL
jgi:hypothetical protein